MVVNDGSKKLLPVFILEVLKRYTDGDNVLTRQEIVNYIESDYGMCCEVRAITRNINLLIHAGYPISKYQGNRKGFYLAKRDFKESELRLLIDAVLASKHIEYTQAKNLVNQLCSLTSIHFKKRNRHIYSIDSCNTCSNEHLFNNIGIIDDAIEARSQISIMYNYYDINKELVPRYKENRIINPYHMLMNNGRYYLMANFPKYDNMAFLRIDYITNVEGTDNPARPIEEISGYDDGLNLSSLRSNYPYLFGGENIRAKFRTTDDMIGDFIDWFGDKIAIARVNEDIIVRLTANRNAIIYWSLQYGKKAELLSPKDLREDIISELEKIKGNYNI